MDTAANVPPYDVLSAPEAAYVFAWWPGEGWVPAARLTVAEAAPGRPVATLDYLRGWRARKGAWALDPVNLPLSDAPLRRAPMHGAVLDSLPDRWGRRFVDDLFERLHDAAAARRGVAAGRRRPGLFDHLFLSPDDRVGALAFGPTPEHPVLVPGGVDLGDLPEAVRALSASPGGPRTGLGTSLGGARPKVTVRMPDGSEWLAKFGRRGDPVDMVRAEHAMMTLAAAAGAEVCETFVGDAGGVEALFVRRFDRDDDGGRRPFLSAQTLLGLRDTDEGGSYAEIADKLAEIGAPPGDGAELFRRMAINVACGNTDDHLKNHGVVMSGGAWRLSPAYDVAPCPDGCGWQAISVGRLGATAEWGNLLSRAERFGLDPGSAAAIAAEVADALAGWRDWFIGRGVSEGDVRRMGHCFGRLVAPRAPVFGPGR
jgi:serine/threonine-protein kinase HipA